jgi:hypothetical protein
MHKLYIILPSLWALMVILLVIMIVLNVPTFGDRCHMYFPEATPLEKAICVEYLSSGVSVSQLKNKMAE